MCIRDSPLRAFLEILSSVNNIDWPVFQFSEQDGNIFTDDSYNNEHHCKHEAEQDHDGGVAAGSTPAGQECVDHYRKAQEGGKDACIDSQLQGHIGKTQDLSLIHI